LTSALPKSFRRLQKAAFDGWILALFIAAVMLGPVDDAVAAQSQRRVLVVYSTRADTLLPTIGDQQFPRLLQDGLDAEPDFYSEYIDGARFPEAEYQVAFRDYLKLKYAGSRFDLVIAAQRPALQFVSTYRDELFRDVPVVFITEDRSTPRLAHSTGTIVERDFRRTVRFAMQLQPDTKEVFVVVGNSGRDRAMGTVAAGQFESFGPKLTFTYLSGLTTQQLERRLSALPEHSIVYYLLFYQDAAGVNLNPLEYLTRLSTAVNRPIYSWVDSTLDHGVVGGTMIGIGAEIGAVADMAIRVLHGENPDGIPVITRDLTSNQVDFRELQRWSIPESRIPAGTRVMFRPPSAWNQYKPYIVGVSALVALQALLIASLLIQASKRRRAEEQVRSG